VILSLLLHLSEATVVRREEPLMLLLGSITSQLTRIEGTSPDWSLRSDRAIRIAIAFDPFLRKGQFNGTH
jgi:hypothetical protein